MDTTSTTLRAIQAAGEDFEWYPTTRRMIEWVARHASGLRPASILDIGAGDGRVLLGLAELCATPGDDRGRDAHAVRELFAIEKSPVLAQRWPEEITPLGSDLFEQNLACLPVDVIFCNPPYGQYETWAAAVIESGYARAAYLVIPRRWAESEAIAVALKRRGATAKVIGSDDFHDAERRARAVVDIVEVTYPRKGREHGYRGAEPEDPFDAWFDRNIDTFDREREMDPDEQGATELARLRGLDSIGELVDAFNDEHARMEANYRAIFKLDYAILKELNVNKEGVRDGIKKKMAGLKAKYWGLLFDRLDVVTCRLATDTKKRFLEKLTGRQAIAFTSGNAYAVVLWAVKHANKYYDEQLVKLFRDLSTFEGVLNYKSNQRTWQRDGWRYRSEGEDPNTHYALDYRVVVRAYRAIDLEWDGRPRTYLADGACNLIADVIAVMGNLGFGTGGALPTHARTWVSNVSQPYRGSDGDPVFEVKAFKNGNLHFRFRPDAIRALNVEAGRLLGWIRGPADVVAELGYSPEEAARYFGCNRLIAPSAVRLLAAADADVAA